MSELCLRKFRKFIIENMRKEMKILRERGELMNEKVLGILSLKNQILLKFSEF
jgi:hypothetical protein